MKTTNQTITETSSRGDILKAMVDLMNAADGRTLYLLYTFANSYVKARQESNKEDTTP